MDDGKNRAPNSCIPPAGHGTRSSARRWCGRSGAFDDSERAQRCLTFDESFYSTFERSYTADFSKHGEKAVARVREQNPASYLKILALLVPREHKVEYSNSLKNWTDEELEAGLDLIKQMLESQAAASGAVIEDTAKPVSMLAHAALEQPERKRPLT